jgi:Protein of unknown function (DUF3617)
MKSKTPLIGAALALAVLSAQAQTQAPGLWEHTVNMKSSGGEMERAQAEMQKQLAAMSPEQRKQMEQMMAGRGMAMGPQGTTMKVCVSKEQAARPAEPRMDGDCTQKDVQRSGNSVRFKFECTKPRPTSGEGEWTFSSDKAYTGRMLMMSEAKGRPQEMKMDMAGKWLGADCGDIKPRVTPAK